METVSLKAKIATFAAGALSVAMIPAGLANDDVAAMFGFKNDVQTHVEAEGSGDEGSVMLHQGVKSDVSANVRADDNHGADVRAAAHQKTDVSGEYDTHGEAVKAVARQKTQAAADAKVRADDADLDVDASSHTSGDVKVKTEDDAVKVHGTAATDASAHADASNGDNHEDGLLDFGGDEDSNDDEDDSSSGLLDDLDLDLL